MRVWFDHIFGRSHFELTPIRMEPTFTWPWPSPDVEKLTAERNRYKLGLERIAYSRAYDPVSEAFAADVLDVAGQPDLFSDND
jgi:hypothetical protein